MDNENDCKFQPGTSYQRFHCLQYLQLPKNLKILGPFVLGAQRPPPVLCSKAVNLTAVKKRIIFS